MLIFMIYLIDKTQDGLTALHHAVRYGRLDCTQLLVQAAEVIDVQDNVRSFDIHTVYRYINTHDISC